MIEVNPSVRVYKIQDAVGNTRVVHRNMLLEVNFLPCPGLDRIEFAHVADQSLTEEESDQQDCISEEETASVSGVLAQGENTQDMSDSRDGEGLAVSSNEGSPEPELFVTNEQLQPSSTLSPALQRSELVICTYLF